jgi:colanic acid biosynthesis glycosyl transferase WcaI
MHKITFICAVFPPEPEPAGVMASQLAAKLSADGHSVTMIVPVPNRPRGRIYEGFESRQNRTTTAPEGYRIVRCPHWLIGPTRRLIDRVMENLTFGISATWGAWRQGRPDVLIVETWPLFGVQCAALLARWWRIPFLYYVQDVYPEAAVHAGYLGADSWVARVLRAWDRRLCMQSAKVIAISPAMSSVLSTTRRLSSGHLAVISNWQDSAEFRMQTFSGAWREEQQIPSSAFVAMFAGTMGHVSGVECLVSVADILRDQRNILILCVGEGIHRTEMEEKAAALHLYNIRFLPFQPRERLVEMQQSANVMLLTMNSNATDSSVPSKLISYMAAGRPVICAANSSTTVATVVREADAGLVIPPDDPAVIARTIKELAQDLPRVQKMGQRSRRYFETNFTLEIAYTHFAAVLNEIRGPALRGQVVTEEVVSN